MIANGESQIKARPAASRIAKASATLAPPIRSGKWPSAIRAAMKAAAKIVYAAHAGSKPCSTKNSTEKAVMAPKPTLLNARPSPGAHTALATLAQGDARCCFDGAAGSGAMSANVATGISIVASATIKGFETFFFQCAGSHKFSTEFIVPEIERQAGKLSLLDRYVVYPVAIALMRDRLLMLRDRFSFAFNQPDWGPGRVDTFNSAKVLFNFPMHQLPEKELRGASDFPSIWNQGKRMRRDDGQRMELHWDGNNTHTEERNKSAAFGTGTTPPTIDLKAIGRVETWLLDLQPPPFPYPVDPALVARGRVLYAEYCAACHGASGQDFSGAKVGDVNPIGEIGTDRARLDSYTYDLAVNQATLYAGYPYRFQYFRKTFGYANMPLDGIWLRSPYLHNGSVPTLRDLLEPASARPARFYRGNDLYDPARVGFVSSQAEEGGHRYFLYDTSVPGNGNRGHEGPAYGTALPAADKDAIVEYLKTF